MKSYIRDLSFQEYRTAGDDQDMLVINASVLKKPTTLEMYIEMSRQSENKITEAIAQGDALHKAALEPDQYKNNFDDHYFMSPTSGIDTKSAQEAIMINQGRIIYNDKILDNVEGMVKAIDRHSYASSLLDHCKDKELTGLVFDEENKIIRKIRVDAAPEYHPDHGNFLLDIKTTKDITYRAFRNDVAARGYHIAAAWYLDTDAMILGLDEPRPNFYFLAVQNTKPFMARVYALLPEDIEKGRDLYKERLAMIIQGYSENSFCAYEHETNPVALSLSFNK